MTSIMSGSDENQNPLLSVEKWSENGGGLRCDEDLVKSLQENHRKRNLSDISDHVRAVSDPCYLDDPDVQCGFPGCSTGPAWLQRLCTKRSFLLVFCLSSVLQGMYFTYFVSVLTTIEKLFQIRSQTAGVIMSATEMGQIVGGLLLSYYGGGGHRPRWIASGLILFGFSASLSALPHFLFGDNLLQDFLSQTPTHENPLKSANLCRDPALGGALSDDSIIDSVRNVSDISGLEPSSCRTLNTNSQVVLGLFFVALLGVGIGQTAVYNLGIPYIDDNVANEESPTYFGTTMGVRILGPTFGFLLGSFCTRLPVNLFSSPNFGPTDPRWIGAWWLGHVILSACLMLTSFIMIMFPKRLPSPSSYKRSGNCTRDSSLSNAEFASLNSDLFEDMSPLTEQSSIESTFFKSAKSSVNLDYDSRDMKALKLNPSSILDSPKFIEEGKCSADDGLSGLRDSSSLKWGKKNKQRSLKDFWSIVSRLLKNNIFVLRTISNVLHMLPIAGLYTFLPKYIETQFKLPVHSAAMISGVGGILVMGFGIFISGFVIRKLNPSPRVIAGWIAATALLYSTGMVILMFLGCSEGDVKGRDLEITGFELSHFRPICDRSCSDCDVSTYAPVCSDEGQSYFSACHAGCRSALHNNETGEITFSDCECLNEGVTARLQMCDTNCSNLFWYVGVFCLFVIIHSTSEVGGMLITLRCVSPQDKAMALGLISVAIGLFANVPCPIIYGAVIDYACIHWRTACDGHGACQIYDPDIFRAFFHGTTAFVMLLAFCADISVWHCCKNMSFPKEEGTKEAPPTPPTRPRPSSSSTEHHDAQSTPASSASSRRKEVLFRGEDEVSGDPPHADRSFEKGTHLFVDDPKPRTLRFQYDVASYPLRESII